MRLGYLFLTGFVAALSCIAQTSTPTAATGGPTGLTGAVVDTLGAPLPGAIVRYLSVPPPLLSTTGRGANSLIASSATLGSVTADASGKFSISGLPSAPVSLCTSTPSTPYLDSCIWGQATRIDTSSGAHPNVTLTLQKGVYLNVRVNDPSSLLPSAIDGPWTPRKLLVGVLYGSGAYLGAANTAVDSAGRVYQMVIPAAVAFKLRVYSSDIVLANAASMQPAAAASISAFQASPGEDVNYTFTVTGHAASSH